MTLNSFYFIPFLAAIFLVIVMLQGIGILLHKKMERKQIFVLLVASYLFIILNNALSGIILLVISFITYISARCISTRNNSRPILYFSVLLLVLILAYFKYMNFFISSYLVIFRNDEILRNIILPLGISFYIFTAIGYLIDVYYGKYSAEKNFINTALLLAYFPKVISGPIVRGNNFFSQLKSYKGVSFDSLLAGIQIFFIGLFKKIVLADHLGVLVDDVFYSPNAFNTGTVILAVISYSLQIYFDFSGYSDMAIGTSKMLGIDIMANFNLPYIASSPSEFWGRWHISLSTWLRDYIYFPLGGSRKGKIRTYINLLLVMLISGLWHGTGWTFLFWGLLHGLYSCIHKFVNKHFGKFFAVDNKSYIKVAAICGNFFIITLFWVFFRASNLTNAWCVIKGCFTVHSGLSQPYTWSFFAIGILLVSTIIAYKRGLNNSGFYPLLNLKKMLSQILFFIFIGMTLLLGYYGNTAFIYGSF